MTRGQLESSVGTTWFNLCFCRWCCPAGFIKPAPSACTGVICSLVWCGWDEIQHLQVRGHGRKRVAWWKGPASSGRVSLVQDWGKGGALEWQADWCSPCTYVVGVSDHCADSKGNDLDLLVSLCSYSQMRSWTLGSDQTYKNADISRQNEFPR